MRLEIEGLAELRERLALVRVEEVMSRALADQAEGLAEAVRDGLSNTPGSAEHDRPWLRSGELRESVGSQTDGLQAVVGTSDPAAAPQEMGTSKMEARPFLAPVAAGMGEQIARAIGEKVAAALRDGSESISGAADSLDVPANATATVSVPSSLRQRSKEPSISAEQSRDVHLAQAWLPLLLEEPPAIVRPPLEAFPRDATKPPGPGFEWRGRPGSQPGDSRGSWYNPETREVLRPDMDHPPPIPPHYDDKPPGGPWYRWFQDGTIVPRA